MTPRLSKTLKVSAETHYHLKLFASYEGVSMAALLDSWVDEHKSFKSILTPEERQVIHAAIEATPKEITDFLASYEEKWAADWPIELSNYVDNQPGENRDDKLQEIVAEQMYRDRAAWNTLKAEMMAIEKRKVRI